jgi:hypothetical protein
MEIGSKYRRFAPLQVRPERAPSRLKRDRRGRELHVRRRWEFPVDHKRVEEFKTEDKSDVQV